MLAAVRERLQNNEGGTRPRALPPHLRYDSRAIAREREGRIVSGRAQILERFAGSAEPLELPFRASAAGVDECRPGGRPERRRAACALKDRRHERDGLAGQPQRRGIERLGDEAIVDRPEKRAGGIDRARARRHHLRDRRRVQRRRVESRGARVLRADEQQQPSAGEQLRPAVVVLPSRRRDRRQLLGVASGGRRTVETAWSDREDHDVIAPRARDEWNGRRLVGQLAQPLEHRGRGVDFPQHTVGTEDDVPAVRRPERPGRGAVGAVDRARGARVERPEPQFAQAAGLRRDERDRPSVGRDPDLRRRRRQPGQRHRRERGVGRRRRHDELDGIAGGVAFSLPPIQTPSAETAASAAAAAATRQIAGLSFGGGATGTLGDSGRTSVAAVSEVRQGECQIARGLKARAGILLEAASQDVMQRRGHRTLRRSRHRRWRIVQHRADRVGRRVADERRPSLEHLEQDAAEREDVGPVIEFLPSGLLRRHVPQRAEHDVRHRAVTRHRQQRLAGVGRLGQLREAEIEDLDGVGGRDEEILRLDVPVHDAALVRRRKAEGDFDRVAHGRVDGKALLLHALTERGPLEQLRHEIW